MKISINDPYSKIEYRPYLDSLRSIAVIYVILFHLFPDWFKGGFIGVDIFFVISGFIVTKTFLNSNFTNLRDGVLGFFLRRVRRILPALFFLFIVVSILSILIIPPEQSNEYVISGAYSLFGLSNIYFTRIASDYFNFASSMNPFTHTWSLGVEEQFYLLLPVVIIGIKYNIKINTKLLLDKNKPLSNFITKFFYFFLILIPFFFIYFIGYKGLTNSFLFIIFALIISFYISIIIFPKEVFILHEKSLSLNNYYFYLLLAFTFLSALASVYLSFNSTLNGYYSVLSRFWELSLGVILCILLSFHETKTIFNAIKRIYPLVVILLILSLIFSLFFIDKDSTFPMPYGIIPVFSTLILIFLSEISLEDKNSFLNKQNLISSFGRVSYSTYLWHWPILIFMQWFFIEKTFLLILIYLSLLLFFSLFSYYLIEQIYIKKQNFISLNIKPLNFFICTIFFGILFSQLNISTNFLNNFFIFSSIADTLPKNELKNAECHGLKWNQKNIKKCLLTSKKFQNSPNIYLFGDSHALNHTPMISELAKENNLNFHYMTGGAFLVDSAKNELDFVKNNVYRNDILILTIHRTYFYDLGKRYFIRDYKYLDKKSAMIKTAYFRKVAEENLKKIIKYAIEREAKLILIHDTPMLGFKNVSACVMQRVLNGYSLCSISKELSKTHRMPMQKLFSKVIEIHNHQDILEWDPHDFLCNKSSCTYDVLESVNYFDDGHLTRSGSLFLKPHFSNFIKENNIF